MPIEPEPDPSRATFPRVLVLVALVAIGIAIFVWLDASGAEGRRRRPEERGRSVRVLAVESVEVVPRAVGYGDVTAQRDWQAIAEVGGVVEFVAAGLEIGDIIAEGAVLVRIDPKSYALEEGKSKASVKGVEAQIAQLKAQERSANANLALEKRSLELARAELETARSLYDAGNAPMTDVQAAEKTVLSAEKSVQGYSNTLAELPASRRILQAQLEEQRAGVQTTQLELAKTEIVAPFTMRVREVNVALDQGVSSGQVLVVGDGLDVVEVPARIPVGGLGALLPPRPIFTGPPLPRDPIADAAGPQAAVQGVEPQEAASATGPARGPGRGSFIERLRSVEAEVRLDTTGAQSSWPGRLRRLEGIDPQTRDLIAVVQVDDTRGRGGPPLSVGLFVEVELRGTPRPDCIAVPRGAFHDGVVYVVGEDDRLSLRAATTDLVQEDFVCLASGLTVGERIVVSDLSPAVEGMLLAPRVDTQARIDLQEAVAP